MKKGQSDVNIRLFRAEDVEAIVALEKAQLDEHEIPSDPADLRAVARVLAASSREGFIVVAEAGGVVTGFAYAACFLSLEYGGSAGLLEELHVQPEWRNRGVGRQLLAVVIQQARELQWRVLELEVVAGHERVIPLYERAGFMRRERSRYSLALGEGSGAATSP